MRDYWQYIYSYYYYYDETTMGIILVCLGVLVILLGIGLFVFQDALSGQHAATKAGARGVFFVMAGTALIGGD